MLQTSSSLGFTLPELDKFVGFLDGDVVFSDFPLEVVDHVRVFPLKFEPGLSHFPLEVLVLILEPPLHGVDLADLDLMLHGQVLVLALELDVLLLQLAESLQLELQVLQTDLLASRVQELIVLLADLVEGRHELRVLLMQFLKLALEVHVVLVQD